LGLGSSALSISDTNVVGSLRVSGAGLTSEGETLPFSLFVQGAERWVPNVNEHVSTFGELGVGTRFDASLLLGVDEALLANGTGSVGDGDVLRVLEIVGAGLALVGEVGPHSVPVKSTEGGVPQSREEVPTLPEGGITA
jgi:hypothetical protein